MPTHPVYRNRKLIGYRWGHHGKLYSGLDARERANKQGVAIHASGWVRKRTVVIRRRDGHRQRYHTKA
jgi:hypothetical protein